jgi:hypothetical protein
VPSAMIVCSAKGRVTWCRIRLRTEPLSSARAGFARVWRRAT